jgi:hypothetical protein
MYYHGSTPEGSRQLFTLRLPRTTHIINYPHSTPQTWDVRRAITWDAVSSGASDAPEDYIALSYVWGVPEYEWPLLSPQGTLYLTRNLEEALKRLRIPQNSISLWADAVCINQEDTRERGHQVALMGRI